MIKYIKKLKPAKVLYILKNFLIVLFMSTTAAAAGIYGITEIKAYKTDKNEPTLYDNSIYNIVFLDSGLFYFCELEEYNTEFVSCNNPYYLVRRKETGADGKQEEKVYVTKPSNEEIYQPDGTIYLSKKNIVYIAKVGDKSAVMEYINKQ